MELGLKLKEFCQFVCTLCYQFISFYLMIFIYQLQEFVLNCIRYIDSVSCCQFLWCSIFRLNFVLITLVPQFPEVVQVQCNFLPLLVLFYLGMMFYVCTVFFKFLLVDPIYCFSKTHICFLGKFVFLKFMCCVLIAIIIL